MERLAEDSRGNLLRHELLLPEVDGDSCVHRQFEGAECRSCVDSCPRGAWMLDDDALALDTASCDGCGLCVATCPTGALHIHFPWAVRSLGGNLVALAACEHSGVEAGEARLPCLHALGLRQLLLLYNSGIRYLLVMRGRCGECDRGPGESLEQRLAQLNGLLEERRAPSLRLLERSPKAWSRLLHGEEVVPRGTRLGRRDFLRGNLSHLGRQLVVLDPLNRPECRTLPPGELLPEPAGEKSGANHWPWAPAMEEERCNGCDACARLCPTGAIELGDGCYRIIPARCTGCGICVPACEEEALEIRAWAAGGPEEIPLRESRCRACGNPFHEPGSGNHAELCRICRHRNHAARLFQVLENT